MTELDSHTIGGTVAPFLEISRRGGDAVDFLQAVAGEALIQANTNPSILSAADHEAVERLREFAGQAATEANLGLN